MIRYVKGESGMAFVAVMIVILLLTVLGAGLLASALLENKIVHGLEDQKQAYYLAQAGVEFARFRLQKNLAWRTTGTGEDLGNGDYTVAVSDNGANNLKIISTGRVGRAQRTLEVGIYYMVGHNDLISELSTYTAISGGEMVFTNQCSFHNMGNLRANGNVKFYNHVSLDGKIILTGNVTEYRNEVTPDQIEKTTEVYDLPEIDWNRLKAEAQSSGKYLAGWDANWDTSSKLVSGKVNYIEGPMTFNIPFEWHPTENTILVIRGNWLVNHQAIITTNKALTIFVDGNVTINSKTEMTAALFASREILINHQLTLSGGIFSQQKVTSNHNTVLTLDPSHLQQPKVEQVLISSGGGGTEEKNTFTLTYWNEK